jgi:hypothetical protein
VTDVLTLPLLENGSRSRDTVAPGATATGPGRPPLFVPKAQLYYWTKEWQRGEAEALSDLEEGRFRTFPDGTSAARWLLADED